MGLFNSKKKSPAPVTHIQEPGDDYSALIAAVHRGEPGGSDRVWEFAFKNPTWCFVRRSQDNPFSTQFNPFCGVVDGKASVFVFTDNKRATQFGVRQQLGVHDNCFTVLSMQRDSAIKHVLACGPSGLEQVVLNDEPPISAFAPLSNLVPMYSHILGIPLAEVATKFDQDVAKALHDRVSQTGDVEHLRELVAWAMKQPEWWMFADPAAPKEPLVWSAVGGEATTAVFTSASQLERSGSLMRLSEPAPHLQLPVAQAVGMLEQLRWAKSLRTVALNMRVSLDADKLGAMYRVLGN